MAGLAFGGRTEQRRHVVQSLDVGLVREIEVTPVRLGLARERGLQVVVGLGAFERLHCCLLGCLLEVTDRAYARRRASVQLIVPIRPIGDAYGAARRRFRLARNASAASSSIAWRPFSITGR